MDGVARVVKRADGWKNMYGFINTSGKEIIPTKYEDTDDSWYRALRFSELIIVGNDNKYGCYDKTGKMVVPLIYSNIGNYSNNLATVLENGKWGYIDKTGKVSIPLIYEYASDFSVNSAIVKKEGKWGTIDTLGNVVIPIIYNEKLLGYGGLLKRKKVTNGVLSTKQAKKFFPLIMTELVSLKKIWLGQKKRINMDLLTKMPK